MKTKIWFLERMDNSEGVIAMPVVIIGLVLALMAGAFFLYFQSQHRLQARGRTKAELDNLNSALVMVLSNRLECRKNLLDGVFGLTVNQLKSLSLSKSIQVRVPYVLKKGQIHRQIEIKELYFDSITQIRNPDPAYLADLHVVTQETDLVAERKTVIPFYFVADATQTFRDCFATLYPQPQKTTPFVTMEDIVCQRWLKDDNYFFAPYVRTCVPGPVR